MSFCSACRKIWEFLSFRGAIRKPAIKDDGTTDTATHVVAKMNVDECVVRDTLAGISDEIPSALEPTLSLPSSTVRRWRGADILLACLHVNRLSL